MLVAGVDSSTQSAKVLLRRADDGKVVGQGQAPQIGELGGPRWWATHTGTVPTAFFTVTKLSWLAEHEPAHATRTAAVLLPHDWLTWRLRQDGAARLPVTAATTDRGDASGTGYFSPGSGAWLERVAEAALGRPSRYRGSRRRQLREGTADWHRSDATP